MSCRSRKLTHRIQLVCVLFVSFLMYAQATWADSPAQTRFFGFGVMLGHPTGLSVKTRLNKREAIAYGAAWKFEEEHQVHLHADYLLHEYNIFQQPQARQQLPVYFGAGLRILHDEDDDDLIGLRIPLGIVFEPAKAPVDVFAEIVPMIDLFPETGLSLHAAVGARFFM